MREVRLWSNIFKVGVCVRGWVSLWVWVFVSVSVGVGVNIV